MYPSDHKPLSTELDPDLLRNKKRRWTDEWADVDESQPTLNLPGSTSNTFTPPPVTSMGQMSSGQSSYYEPTPKPKEEPKVVDAKTRKFVEGIFGVEEQTEKPRK
jgi:hypothetical protein